MKPYKRPHFWEFWGPDDWFIRGFVVFMVLAVIALTVVLAVGIIRDPHASQTEPPAKGTHRVCTTWFMPVSTGKSVILVPEHSCHDEPDHPNK